MPTLRLLGVLQGHADFIVRLPVVVRAVREALAETPARRPDPRPRQPIVPAAATLCRQGLLGLVGGASLTLLMLNVGEWIGGPLSAWRSSLRGGE